MKNFSSAYCDAGSQFVIFYWTFLQFYS